jgi:hypothetical protein
MDAQERLQAEADGADEEAVGFVRANHGAFGDLDPAEVRRLGRFAGILMIVGALVSVPAGLVLDPAPKAYEYLVALGSAVLGVVALRAPWEQLSSNWLHAAIVIGTIEVAAGVAVFSDDYAFLYVLVAMYAAYVIRDRATLLAYMAFFTLALVAPLLYTEGDLKEQTQHILVTLPVFMIAAAIVLYLRDTLEEREREYRGFAFEAVTLAERIRGHSNGESEDGDLEVRLDRLAAAEPVGVPREDR